MVCCWFLCQFTVKQFNVARPFTDGARNEVKWKHESEIVGLEAVMNNS